MCGNCGPGEGATAGAMTRRCAPSFREGVEE